MRATVSGGQVPQLPMLALRGLVLFPHMLLHFDVGRAKSMTALQTAMTEDQKIFLVTQKDIREEDPTPEQFYKTGVIAQVRQIIRLQNNSVRVLVEGMTRAKLVAVTAVEPCLRAAVRPVRERRIGDETYAKALIKEMRKEFEEYAALEQNVPPDILLGVVAQENPGYVADFVAANLPMDVTDKQRILNEFNPSARLEQLLLLLRDEIEVLRVEKGIQDKVQEQVDKNQREYYLREQLKAISSELSEDDNPQEESQRYRERIEQLSLPENISAVLLHEANKLYKMPLGSQEATVVRNYLDTCLELPWNAYTKENHDLTVAKKALDKSHYGMDKVKDRILDLIAVKSLAPEVSGQILCLTGPPGVGKTSIAKAIAQATGRKYARVSLGGVRDEAEIRGHRRTYIGAMPGRVVSAIKQAGAMNALILLDEVDKLAADFRGDPAAALLEVLDSEQNSAFCDHYIEVPLDLSRILFITTANDVNEIPAPLYDRMEILTLPSYTHEEKFHIARQHLIPKQLKKHGLNQRMCRIRDEAVHAVIDGYTREAGVRTLDRTLATLCRRCARRLVDTKAKTVTVAEKSLEELLGVRKFRVEDRLRTNEVGVVTGLAWTAVGGETMPVEVAVLDGTGKLELTGSLGDVMKESAHAAVSYIRAHAAQLGVEPDFYKTRDIHIHIPEGAVPKDGPSAGVTLATALVSALSGRAVYADVAMTGEITLRGRVLAIGGLREKTMAAYRGGIKTVVIPEENRPELAELSDEVKNALRFVTASHLHTVLECALVPLSEQAASDKTDVLPELPAFPQTAMTNQGGKLC